MNHFGRAAGSQLLENEQRPDNKEDSKVFGGSIAEGSEIDNAGPTCMHWYENPVR